MQELRLVLILVGGLAIVALLVHGLWSSKKEGKSKFGAKAPEADLDTPLQNNEYANDDFEVIRKTKSEPSFGAERSFDSDPLVDPLDQDIDLPDADEEFVPQVNLDEESVEEQEVIFSNGDEMISRPRKVVSEPVEPVVTEQYEEPEMVEQDEAADQAVPAQEEPEEQLEVIVLNVHSAQGQEFKGSKLFDSMERNGLKYGEMDIFHRHSDMSGTGKVLFSVANMMRPGTLKHDDPETFTTKGISFFMTLPCYGDPEQNFKLMLKTAQQIADDMSGNVQDDQRNMMTPDKLDEYKLKIRDFKARNAQA
ncbi:cell division protein ZipA [Vibrio sp. JC009]|uniref:cell division protein ZipA n=1 Tax=Vibrio sp. JC009 TaxID=2912314 RepID=UPI0023B19995|nr:cell division protein ZipA [Vibrio sp. JC009]WED21019.1 cell division protein ZipA [Vibrio sp. JC009]